MVSDVNLTGVADVKRGAGRRGSGQHHGDLRNALLDVAQQLVSERGPLGWSMAEASRRAGVSVAAPYKHFADRDDLVAALAARGFERLGGTLRAATAGVDDPVEQLVVFTGCYVRFAHDDRALFDAAYNTHRDKAAHPSLSAASQAIYDLLLEPARAVIGEADAGSLVIAVGAVTHGYSALLLQQGFGDGPAALAAAQEQAERSVRDLIDGMSRRLSCGVSTDR
jgi:AcrR family transcriptional regulator